MRKVTFGIVNCNRLHYLKSCVKSLVDSIEDHDCYELIIVDNASVEEGTTEFLSWATKELGSRSIVFHERSPNNEFARALNTIVEKSTCELVCPIQGDCQFVVKGWLPKYLELFEKSEFDGKIGSVILDAQRRVTIENSTLLDVGLEHFCVDISRSAVAGAGDVMYKKDLLKSIGGWREQNNENHEYQNDSESEFLERTRELNQTMVCFVPYIPPAIMIYTDARGTNARVRGDKRYGDYWPAKGDRDRYYEFVDSRNFVQREMISIEQIAFPIGWNAPIDQTGSWMKNPIRPESAQPCDWKMI